MGWGQKMSLSLRDAVYFLDCFPINNYIYVQHNKRVNSIFLSNVHILSNEKLENRVYWKIHKKWTNDALILLSRILNVLLETFMIKIDLPKIGSENISG